MSNIPEDVVTRVADEYLPTHDFESFIRESFIQVLVEKGHKPHQTQARASVTGNTYELCLVEIFDRYYPWLEYEQDVPLPDAGMGNRQGADFVFYTSDEHTPENIHSVIEAKGSADILEWPDGTVQEPSRPGLQRTDTMKKAICQAYQIKAGINDDIPFYILTTHKPESGNGKEIYDLAIGDIVDNVVDTTNKQEILEFGDQLASDLIR